MFYTRKIIKILVAFFVFSTGPILAGLGDHKAAIFAAFIARDQVAFQRAMEAAAADPSFSREELIRWAAKALEKKGLTYTPTPGDGGEDEEHAEIRAIREAIAAVGLEAFKAAVAGEHIEAILAVNDGALRGGLIELFGQALLLDGWRDDITARAREIFTVEELRGLRIDPLPTTPPAPSGDERRVPTKVGPEDLLTRIRTDQNGLLPRLMERGGGSGVAALAVAFAAIIIWFVKK